MEKPPRQTQRWLFRPRVRHVLSWLLAVAASAVALGLAWFAYANPQRRDGNEGHVYADFGGQWVLARMLVTGQGRHLYDRPALRGLIDQSFPAEQGDPNDPDADRLFDYLIGGRADSGAPPQLGGPLYPPIHAVLFAPLALLPPQPAYRVMQILTLLLAWLGAWLIRQLTHGNIAWPVAVVLLLIYPGFPGAICLAQNAMLSLTLLLLSWLLLERDRPVAGGVVWGLLAYKPVWAAAFFLVPLLLRRWRFAAAMLLTGVLLALLTLPLVGVRTWLDWLALGRLASVEYGRLERWIFLSRDLQGIPRRWLLHFIDEEAVDPDRLLPTLLGVGLWLTVAAVTVVVGLRRGRRSTPLEGAGAAFVLLGAWLTAYHFMYYDVLLTALPLCLLFTQPRRYLDCIPARLHSWMGLDAVPLRRPGLWGGVPVLVLLPLIGLPYLCTLLVPDDHYPPFDTFCVLLLWAWCGWMWLREPSSSSNTLDLSRS